MNSKIKNKIIIWGADNFNTLGLLREFGEVGVSVYFLIKGEKSYASKSKYCIKYHCVKDNKAGYDFLIKTFKSETEKPIIVTSGDDIAVFIDRHKDILEKYFIVSGTAIKGMQEKYTDKNTMTLLASKLGICCPESRFCSWNSNIENVKYPCLIKPAHEKVGHYNEFKFRICKNKKSLKRTLAFVRHDSEFILQDFVPKEKDILVYGARMWNGETVLAGAMIRDRLADSGSSSHGLMTAKIPSCIDQKKIGLFLNEIDYHGLFSFEYGLVGDKAYFFEVNLRNDGTSHYFYQAGANIPLAYAYSCVGMDYSEVSTTVAENKWFIDEVFDFENVIKGNVSYKRWKEDRKTAEIFKYYEKNDKEPWKYVVRRKWRQTAMDLILKRFRVYIIYLLDKLGLKK